jgi:hypothetical protein
VPSNDSRQGVHNSETRARFKGWGQQFKEGFKSAPGDGSNHAQRRDALRAIDFSVPAGVIGRKISVRSVGLLGLLTGAPLQLGNTIVAEVTGASAARNVPLRLPVMTRSASSPP